jgi:hypothetical protein
MLVSADHQVRSLERNNMSLQKADCLADTCKAIAKHENRSCGGSFVTVLPQSDSVEVGGLALAVDHNELQKMKRVSLASLSSGMCSSITQNLLQLVADHTLTDSMGEYSIQMQSSSSLSAAFKAKLAGKGAGAGSDKTKSSSTWSSRAGTQNG